MSSGGGKELKRKASTDVPVSPPPLRRKVQSTTTKTAVASFFTPVSQKPPEKTIWQERGPDDDTPATLLVGKYEPKETDVASIAKSFTTKRSKFAAFDFDSTLIQTSSGKVHASDGQDWKWWHPTVPGILQKLYTEDSYHIVVISNQAGIALKSDSKAPRAHHSRLSAFKQKVSSVFNHLDLPITIYAATEKDIYRKPRTGMWKELLVDYELHSSDDVNLTESIFVGDAGGRFAGGGMGKDHSSSDRDFADNVGLKFFTPEEFFLKQAPREFKRTFEPLKYLAGIDAVENKALLPFSKKNDQDMVLFCGSPGAGKSTWYWNNLQLLGYVRINQDILKTRDKCIKLADEALSEGKSVAIDNTNADLDVRSKWIGLAAKHKIPIRCVLFLADPVVCEHNNAVRALNNSLNPEKRSILPKIAFTGFNSRYKRPEISEGFQDITEVQFKFYGTEAERAIWTRYWT